MATALLLGVAAYGVLDLGSTQVAIYIVAVAVFCTAYAVGEGFRGLIIAGVIAVANGLLSGQTSQGLLGGLSKLAQRGMPVFLSLLFLVIIIFGFFMVFGQHHRLHSRKTGSSE